jgi:hypothetical protein
MSRPSTGGGGGGNSHRKSMTLQQRHEVGLPSVWSESSMNRPISASLSLFHAQGTYERPSAHNYSLSSFGNDDSHWEQHSFARPRTTESQSPGSQHLPPRGGTQQQRLNSGQSRGRPISSTRGVNSSRPSTAESVEEILSSHQINQYHRSRKFMSSK